MFLTACVNGVQPSGESLAAKGGSGISDWAFLTYWAKGDNVVYGDSVSGLGGNACGDQAEQKLYNVSTIFGKEKVLELLSLVGVGVVAVGAAVYFAGDIGLLQNRQPLASACRRPQSRPYPHWQVREPHTQKSRKSDFRILWLAQDLWGTWPEKLFLDAIDMTYYKKYLISAHFKCQFF